MDLLLKAVLLVCQLFGKTQLPLEILNHLPKQLFRFLAFGFLRLL